MAKRAKDHDSFSHSMTDLMAGVAVMFLLIAAIFMVQVANRDAEEKAKGRKASEALDKITSTDKLAISALLGLRDSLKGNVDLDGLELLYNEDRDPFLLTIVLDRSRLRFDVGDCAIRADTREAMESSFGVIFGSVCATADSGFIQSITLEGHTDNRPFFPADRTCGVEPTHRSCNHTPDEPSCSALGFANNVRLSAARAQNVFFEMRKMLGAREDIARCLDTKFVVAGRGPVEPADGGDWKAGREGAENERNRRVVIKVRAIARSTVASNEVVL
jgi:flagellar motor protein MotB